MCFHAIGLAILGAVAALSHATQASENAELRPLVIELRLEDEAITPITARFISRAIAIAQEQRASCLVIVLDTPGGLVDSTRQIVKEILRSEVPVVVYVAPSGARAASAGVFVTMAGHVAAMAPGTNIGAAHPVELGGLPSSVPPKIDEQTEKDSDEPSTPREAKAVNDTVAWARSLAELRGRNADWAAAAVKESLSVSANAALQEGAIDLLAEDLNDLLAKLHGREVKTLQGTVKLDTQGASVRLHQMWWGEQVLAALAKPNLAFLLLIFGFYGVLFELYSPGWGVAGTLGVICLVLAFLALAILPVNYVGLLLIALALALFVAEVFVTSFGALTLGGAVCLMLGGILLVDSPAGFIGVSLNLLVPISLATAAVTFFLLGSIVRAHRGRVQTGGAAMVGAQAVAAEDFVVRDGQYGGMVRAHGELWQACSREVVRAGQSLSIAACDGLTLQVQPVARSNPVDSPQAVPPS